MRYGSVCSGVEAATVAWHPLGWEPQWFSEIEKFPSAVLQHHYPNVPNYGDMTKFKEWPDDRSIELLVGGTPCQSFSVAGLRKGLDDPRGNLMLTYLAIAAQHRPRWLVWENVPGVLSSNRGRDFGTFIGALGKLGYGFAYRVLDAQYFGVAQRRRRVFVVGYLGDWRRAAAVLFERESLSGHPAPSREAREEVADTLTVGANQYSGFIGEPVEAAVNHSAVGALCARTGRAMSVQDADQGHIIPQVVGKTLTAGCGQRLDTETEDFVVAFGAQNSASQGDSLSEHVTPTLDKSKTPAVAYGWSEELNALKNLQPTIQRGGQGGRHEGVAYGIPGNWIGRKPENGGNATKPMNDIAPNLTSADRHAVSTNMQVRRLTPRECERLQGFPDDYTQIPWRNKAPEDCPDGPRYKAMGNSMAVPVMRWIGERIQMVEDIT